MGIMKQTPNKRRNGGTAVTLDGNIAITHDIIYFIMVSCAAEGIASFKCCPKSTEFLF
jgi:hypothetical protein